MKPLPFLLNSMLLLMICSITLAGKNTSGLSCFTDTDHSGISADTLRLNFESIPDFSLMIPPWQNIDLDHHSTYGIQNHTFPNDTVAKAFMCFNPAAVTPPMSDSAIKPHSGTKFGACFSAIPPRNNDWLISPRVHLQQNGQFSFWVKSYTDAYGLEEYKVLISVTDSATSSFTQLSGPQPLRAPTAWTRKLFDLSAYNNQDVYLAIQCVSNDHFILMVDDIETITNSSGQIKADFTADKTQISIGESVNFQDLSSGFPTTWQWTFTGGMPASSTAPNPAGIKYNAAGNYDVTLTAGNGTSTDTKTITSYIKVGGYPSSATLDFEDLANFTLNFFPWTTLDVKGGSTYTMVDTSGQPIVFPHSGQPMAYICFNPSATNPPETFMKPHSGQRLGCCFSSIPPNNPNNKWLISPRLTLGTNSFLDLWVMTYNKAYGLERYNIAVSTTDNNPSSFTYLSQQSETAPETWTHYYYDLKDYNHRTVYVAIQCISDTSFIFMVDDIRITSVAGIGDQQENFGITVYPNPARDYLNFSCSLPSGTTVEAELVDMLGVSVRSAGFKSRSGSETMDIRDLNPGVYSLLVQANGHRVFQKVIIQ